MNNVNLIGCPARDPERRQVRGGAGVVCAIRIAVDVREWSGRDRRKRSAHSMQGKVAFLCSPAEDTAEEGGELEDPLELRV